MKMNGVFSLVVGIACLNLVTASQAMRRIEPELDPVSDKKFFKRDYPDDARPAQYHQFGHPYPTIQDSDHYDKDYVKDENDDGGYWKAQMEYDALKTKLQKEIKEMTRAKAKETEEENEFGKAKAAEDAAEKLAQAAEKAEVESASDRKKADAEHDTIKDALDEATGDVEKEVKDLRACQEELAEAKRRLKNLLAELEAMEKRKAEKDKLEEGAESEEKAASKTADELWQIYLKQKAEYEAAYSNIAKEKKDVKEAEDRLAKAAAELRKFRHADPDGGVYEVAKSGASTTFPLVNAALLLVASAACLL